MIRNLRNLPFVLSLTTKPPPTLQSALMKMITRLLGLDLPEVLIRSKQIAVMSENGEAHPIRMCLEYLVPAPQHVAVHVICNAVLPTKHERFVFENCGIP